MAGTGNRRSGKEGANTGGIDPAAGDDFYDGEPEATGEQPQSLGEVAAAGLHAVTSEQGGVQEVAPGMEYNTHLSFLGMGYRTNDADYKLGQPVSFVVEGRVVESGDKLMADEHQRHIVKVRVTSVTMPDGGE